MNQSPGTENSMSESRAYYLKQIDFSSIILSNITMLHLEVFNFLPRKPRPVNITKDIRNTGRNSPEMYIESN